MTCLLGSDYAERNEPRRTIEVARCDVHLIDLQRADLTLRRVVFAEGRRLYDRSGGRLRELEIATLIEYVDGEYLRRLIDEGHRRRLERALG